MIQIKIRRIKYILYYNYLDARVKNENKFPHVINDLKHDES